MPFDHYAAFFLVPVALWILISGLDDAFIGLVFLFSRPARSSSAPPGARRRIAVFVPCWREHDVLAEMLEHNVSVVRYSNYDIFVGVYPNDPLTVRAARQTSERLDRVHVVLCPHDGPTSKADCLNAIYRGMQEHEALHHVRFEVVVTHDAEDLIHPDSFALHDAWAGRYEMVQIPVLPLPTGLAELTHGVYCDEFAEYQTKDIPVRQRLGGFLPSNGVGTGYRREALDRLARRGPVFDPDCLTEDYENGFRIHAAGGRQLFVRLSAAKVATREYFPRTWRQAVRQRTRWVTGISLQGWQRHGWRVPARQIYWLWRDRKGLVGNLLSPLANAVFAWGGAAWALSAVTGAPWRSPASLPDFLLRLCAASVWVATFQIFLRAACSARIYGLRFACGVPVRMLWANCINFAATATALWQYAAARRAHTPLAWRKTDHVYPDPGPAADAPPRLGELLLRMGVLSARDLHYALAGKPAHVRLGDHLVLSGLVLRHAVSEALAAQRGMPFGCPEWVDPEAARAVPARLCRVLRALPFQIAGGRLHVAVPEIPSPAATAALGEACGLRPKFQLVGPEEFDALVSEHLPPKGRRNESAAGLRPAPPRHRAWPV